MSAFLRALSRRIRLALHRHDPMECWCELTAADAPKQDPRPVHDPDRRGRSYCPDCWTPPGQRHELSCPEVSYEQYRAYMDGWR